MFEICSYSNSFHLIFLFDKLSPNFFWITNLHFCGTYHCITCFLKAKPLQNSFHETIISHSCEIHHQRNKISKWLKEYQSEK